ncbi:MAG: hypothetical protein GY868_09660 [Deltaproteobacteria bacterium]|nr:hypothetical protein [Deltaproteobacteria bacterium]
MEGLSLEKLTQRADLVIAGEVESVASDWSDDSRFIYTSVTVSLLEVIRGKCLTKHIKVEYKGGKVGEQGMGVSDAPALQEGQTVILFLRPVWSYQSKKFGFVYRIVGASQGAYVIDEQEMVRKGGFAVMRRDKNVVDMTMDMPLESFREILKKIE